ncbi:hypothetical protein ABEG10_08395 [Burkholderia cenocepacia]|uniref:hypothetical protein n=1 Tax=Burkholderia cenocepacia TaxID=95486 RepID=UPI0020A10C3A|nr:hypothetical protein [Burkholderia cenocepacia]MCO8321919.1 hypothetical protein [Burkholderia cenocepacia]MCO8329203.1 hypothetical protein [Burkholderia cenocepacia]MCO8336676.1 hypothetical protein [Burkholderia cenocepacia]MCO8343961.1 hypothetical protein [Burkholderia cenocepacia]MCO8357056.1 hypothetical protein [Burkholderia cenocepacia]
MEKIINRYVAVVGAVLLGAIGYEYVPWSEFGPSDWASWAQTVGTVAAIGATVWIATREDRRRHKEAYDLAVLTAASMRLRTSGVLARVRYIAAKIDAAHKHDAAPESLRTFAEYIRDITVCSDEEQAKLIPLPNRCAFRLAGSRDNLHAAAESLESLMSSIERLNYHRRKETFGMAALATSEAERQLKAAVAECQKASLAVTSPHDD